MVAFQPSCTCVRHAHARDGLLQRFCLSIGVQQWVESSFVPLLFSKKNQENQKWGYQVSPAVGGEETRGCMRPVLA
jgi:hypothetical protein